MVIVVVLKVVLLVIIEIILSLDDINITSW